MQVSLTNQIVSLERRLVKEHQIATAMARRAVIAENRKMLITGGCLVKMAFGKVHHSFRLFGSKPKNTNNPEDYHSLGVLKWVSLSHDETMLQWEDISGSQAMYKGDNANDGRKSGGKAPASKHRSRLSAAMASGVHTLPLLDVAGIVVGSRARILRDSRRVLAGNTDLPHVLAAFKAHNQKTSAANAHGSSDDNDIYIPLVEKEWLRFSIVMADAFQRRGKSPMKGRTYDFIVAPAVVNCRGLSNSDAAADKIFASWVSADKPLN